MNNPQFQQEIVLPVTHLEAITINAAINMTLRFNTYLPPESQAIFTANPAADSATYCSSNQ